MTREKNYYRTPALFVLLTNVQISIKLSKILKKKKKKVIIR
jgi:hypothetical protein